MNTNILYAGGRSPGSALFAVDGNFLTADPCGPPVISSLFKGDTVYSNLPIWLWDELLQVYTVIPFGTYPNIQPFNPNQVDIMLEQKFMVAQQAYKPMRLNTYYNSNWAIGCTPIFTDGSVVRDNLNQIYNLSNILLVDESPLEDAGAGISVFTRKWISLPHTRNIIEQYPMTFPAVNLANPDVPGTSTLIRDVFTQNVVSRIQSDFFIIDDWNITAVPLFNPTVNGAQGKKLNSTTGLYPAGLILQKFQPYSDPAKKIVTDILDDSSYGASTPTATEYVATNGWAEIVAEPSTFAQFMGNVYVRKTRFVLVQ